MNDYTLVIVLGLVVIGLLSALAANAESALWRRSKRRNSARRSQQQITMGKSTCR